MEGNPTVIMSFRPVITTSDRYLHLLPGFCHQWNQYTDGLHATIVYLNDAPPMPLPDNFDLIASPARFHDWSGSLANALDRMHDEIVLLGLEDYWLSGPVDWVEMGKAVRYITYAPDVKRIDLTQDRAAFPHVMRDGYYQAVIDPNAVQYVLSTQFSLWRRDWLIHCLRLSDAVIPPQFEVEVSRIAAKEQPVILGTGTRVLPCHGDGVVWNGRVHDLHLEYLTPEDQEELKRLGYA
jgi:hypothetical protein